MCTYNRFDFLDFEHSYWWEKNKNTLNCWNLTSTNWMKSVVEPVLKSQLLMFLVLLLKSVSNEMLLANLCFPLLFYVQFQQVNIASKLFGRIICLITRFLSVNYFKCVRDVNSLNLLLKVVKFISMWLRTKYSNTSGSRLSLWVIKMYVNNVHVYFTDTFSWLSQSMQ